MSQNHAFYYIRNILKEANFKKTTTEKFILLPRRKIPVLRLACNELPDIRQAPCVNETHIINVTAGLSMPAVSVSRREIAYSAAVRSAIRIRLTVSVTTQVSLCDSSLHVTICPLFSKVHSYASYNNSVFKP
jgi:hypothetical protein